MIEKWKTAELTYYWRTANISPLAQFKRELTYLVVSVVQARPKCKHSRPVWPQSIQWADWHFFKEFVATLNLAFCSPCSPTSVCPVCPICHQTHQTLKSWIMEIWNVEWWKHSMPSALNLVFFSLTHLYYELMDLMFICLMHIK